MVSFQRFGLSNINRFIIFGLVIWWLVMFIGYSVISFRVSRVRDNISQSGIKIAQEFSKLVSLPLLEKEDNTIHSLLTDAANKKGVIYASVVDHRNKVVAFTGAGHLMPDMTNSARSIDNVSVWEGGFASHSKILNFAADITYAGTKIGEIFIGLSTTETMGTRNQFITVAVVSFLILLSIFAVFRYRANGNLLRKFSDKKLPKPATDQNAKESLIQCPMCGTQKHFSKNLFKQLGRENFLTIGSAKPNSSTTYGREIEKIELHDLTTKADLSWLRRQVILRCTEIINKLAA